MNDKVIGAAGITGHALVEQALSDGHQVTAFVGRTATYQRADMRVIEADAADGVAMEAAVLGQDALLDTIGGKIFYKNTTLESSAAQTIFPAMRRKGVPTRRHVHAGYREQ